MKKNLLISFLSLMTLLIGTTACDSEPTADNTTKTYYWVEHEKVSLEVINNKAYIAFYPENEEKLKAELSKLDLTLTEIEEGTDLNAYYQLQDKAAKTLLNYKTASVIGDYTKAKSILAYTIGWSPYYKVIDEKDFMLGREIASNIYFSAKIADGVDESRLKEFAKQNKVLFGGQDKTMKKWYIFIVTNESRGNTLEMANLFQESAVCEYASPDFIGMLGLLANSL